MPVLYRSCMSQHLKTEKNFMCHVLPLFASKRMDISERYQTTLYKEQQKERRSIRKKGSYVCLQPERSCMNRAYLKSCGKNLSSEVHAPWQVCIFSFALSPFLWLFCNAGPARLILTEHISHSLAALRKKGAGSWWRSCGQPELQPAIPGIDVSLWLTCRLSSSWLIPNETLELWDRLSFGKVFNFG